MRSLHTGMLWRIRLNQSRGKRERRAVKDTDPLRLAQITTAGILWATGDVTPWVSSRGWWTVHGMLTDAGCLLLRMLLLRQEGLRLRDVFGLTRTNWGTQHRLRAAGARHIIADYEGMDGFGARMLFGSYVTP